ncbi:MAG: hypothetical protein OEY03_00775, partial [Rhizobacter sp.]|nr:hypothetical protein [Rhizobacter sp.]
YRAGASAAGPVAPVGFTLAEGGTTLLVADQAQPRWVEHRPVGALAITVRPGADGADVRSVDGLAGTGDTVFVLDRASAGRHVARRDGQLSGRLGDGELKQPVAIAADRFGRVFVVDAHDRAVKVLSLGRPAQVFDTTRLRVQAIAAIAVDERLLAVADGVAGQVLIHTVRDMERP